MRIMTPSSYIVRAVWSTISADTVGSVVATGTYSRGWVASPKGTTAPFRSSQSSRSQVIPR